MKTVLRFKVVLLTVIVTLLESGPARAELRIGGFTDLSFYATDADASPNSGFKEGQLVLHLNSALSDRAYFFAELTWTPKSSEFATEVERAIFKYQVRDALKASVGRYHTPVSWWNVAYHHGTWLQTSVDRPLAAKFGSKFLPIHFVGAMAEGNLFPGKLTVGYAAGIGNGRSENVARAGDAGDVNDHRALLLQVTLRHDVLYDLEIGGSVYADRFPMANARDIDEQILSAFVVLKRETPELLAEVFLVRHQDDFMELDTDNSSYYVQAGYRLPWLDEVFKPYARYEHTDIDGMDRAFAGAVFDLRRVVAGVRIDIATQAAIKLEGRRFEENGGTEVNEVYTTLCVAF